MLRNFANRNENYQVIRESKTIEDLVICLKDYYSAHRELTLNICRFLSKLSADTKSCEVIARSNPYSALLGILRVYGVNPNKEFLDILNRATFILGNLTTHYDEAR